MGRLTWRIFGGEARTEMNGNMIQTINPDTPAVLTGDVVEKLADYEELEEQGLLLRLPCKEGTKVYLARKCLALSCEKCRGYLNVNNCLTQYKGRIFEQEFDIRRHLRAFGKTVFLTYEAAEAALAEQESRKMREILFKAKRTDTGEWVEGCYVYYGWTGKQRHYIVPNYASDLYAFEVDPETVCQYAGLTDKNGRKIWENDIVEFDDTGEEGHEYKEGFDFQNRAVVIWNNGRFELDKPMSNNSEVLDFMNNCYEDFWDALRECEVIGNLFDNPDLLKGGDDT